MARSNRGWAQKRFFKAIRLGAVMLIHYCYVENFMVWHSDELEFEFWPKGNIDDAIILTEDQLLERFITERNLSFDDEDVKIRNT